MARKFSILLLLLLPLLLFGVWRSLVNERKTRALVAAIEVMDRSRVQTLIKQGTDVNATTRSGESPLMAAAYLEDEKTLALLEKSGAYVKGDTGLFVASIRGDTALAARLLKEGANPSAKDKDGDAVLVYAVRYNRLPIVKLLVKNGADVNAHNKKGVSILMSAAERAQTETMQLLLKRGAIVHAKDNTKEKEYQFRYVDNTGLTEAVKDKGNFVNIKFCVDSNQKAVTSLRRNYPSVTTDKPGVRQMILRGKLHPRVYWTPDKPNMAQSEPYQEFTLRSWRFRIDE